MKVSDETKVGVLAAFGITILVIGYSFLRGKNLFEKKKYYYAIYNKVDGLNMSDPVTLNGLPIGKVASLTLLDDSTGLAVAKLHLAKPVKIPKNSSFQLYSSDLLGEKAVQLVLGDSKQLAEEGDTLAGNVSASLQEEVSMQILPVKEKAEDLLGSIDSVIDVVKGILRGGQIENSLKSLEKATGSFAKVGNNLDSLVAEERGTLKSIFNNLNGITANLDSNSENIDHIFSNLAQLSDSLNQANLKQTVTSLNKSLDELQELLGRINHGDGTVGMLVTERGLYDNLNGAIKNLESLLADVEANPKKYVHFSLFGGSKEKKEEVAEKKP